MNFSICIPTIEGITNYDASDYTKDELIDALYNHWLCGDNLELSTTELSTNIIDLSKFTAEWVNAVDLANIQNNETTEQEVKEALEACISDEWDTLHTIISDYDENFADACLEYANGGSLEESVISYMGCYDTDEIFIRKMNEDLLSDMPKHLQRYFDWERYTSDAMHDYSEINGHYFIA